MLKHYVAPQLEEFQLRVVFQQDSAPPHRGLRVRDFLNETFPNRWIRRNGPTPWPPRSPDITPLDFFLWGYVKDRVYRTPVCDVKTLQSRIIEVLATVNEEMLENTWRKIEYRLLLKLLEIFICKTLINKLYFATNCMILSALVI